RRRPDGGWRSAGGWLDVDQCPRFRRSPSRRRRPNRGGSASDAGILACAGKGRSPAWSELAGSSGVKDGGRLGVGLLRPGFVTAAPGLGEIRRHDGDGTAPAADVGTVGQPEAVAHLMDHDTDPLIEAKAVGVVSVVEADDGKETALPTAPGCEPVL